MTDKIQYASGYHPGDDIIDHNPHAAVHVAIKPTDRPGFPHIQNAENNEPGSHLLPVRRRQRH